MSKQFSGQFYSMDPKPQKPTGSGVERNANTVVDSNHQLKNGGKIVLLDKCLYEFCKRLHMLHGEPPNKNQFQSVTFRLRDILKIYSFYPNNDWFLKFKRRHDLNFLSNGTPRPGTTSLDLHEIVRFCSRSAPKKSVARKINSQEIIEISSDEESSKPPPKRKVNIKHNASPMLVIKKEKLETEVKAEKASEPPGEVHTKRKVNIKHNVSPMLVIKKEKLQTEVKAKKASELPGEVHTYEGALNILKPIDQFARKENNFEAIAALSRLVHILKAGGKVAQKKVFPAK